MTTTSIFQKLPDYYNTKEECMNFVEKEQTNPRYKNFTQAIFHAGDEEQFQQYRDETNGDLCISEISLENNIFKNTQVFQDWYKYNDLTADCVFNTFSYIFHKFKKGIFVKIKNNKLDVFLPFSKVNFKNEWSHKIKIDPTKFTSLDDFMRHVSELDGRRDFNPERVNKNIDEWYGNNCLVRYEYPINETENNITGLKNFIQELCENRQLPDIEFFLNRRDFPLLKRDSSEPYDHIWDSHNHPLVSHNYNKYSPILSMSSSNDYADLMIPTWDDWCRVQYKEHKYFPRGCKDYDDHFNTPWNQKLPTVVFRGGTTGCGVDIDTNKRIKLAYISHLLKKDKDKKTYLDAGITNWNVRPKKLLGQEYIKTVEYKNLPFTLVNKLSPQEQSKYKYIVHVEGNVSAFRLSLELSMNSVILLVDSQWKIWYSHMLEPYKHYIPIKADLSDLIEKIEWCRNNDSECEQIAKNAKIFYTTYLNKNAIFDYTQKLIINIKEKIGIYMYNEISPINLQIQQELNNILNIKYPNTTKNITNINTIPNIPRCYSLLKGIEWIFNLIKSTSNIEFPVREIFSNKLGSISDFSIANFNFIDKKTTDIQKSKEHIHETFIGLNCINNILKYIPNFSYIFGLYQKENETHLISEKINGITFLEYLNSKTFNFKDYLNIICQIALAIQVSQNLYCFVHNDLTPWNIIIQQLPEEILYDFVINNKVIRIKTSIIPIIIDYGKSHAIIDNKHYGLINMYKMSNIQDILTILLTSIDIILSKQTLEKEKQKDIIYIANFLTGNQYAPNKFNNIRELKNFVNKNKKYTTLINDNKYELENKNPLDLVKYILRMKDYPLKIGFAPNYDHSIMNKGNARQIFEYILSNNAKEKAETFKNVFYRIKQSTIPQPTNIFFKHYVAQMFDDNLQSVKNMMIEFLQQEKINPISYTQIADSTITFLDKLYQTNKKDNEEIQYNIIDNFETLILPKYNEHTFLNPNEILELLKNNQDLGIDYSDYIEIINIVLLNNKKYKLTDKEKQFYKQNFEKLLNINLVNMKNNIANNNTLKETAKIIFEQDLEKLENIDCQFKNINIYKQINQILT